MSVISETQTPRHSAPFVFCPDNAPGEDAAGATFYLPAALRAELSDEDLNGLVEVFLNRQRGGPSQLPQPD